MRIKPFSCDPAPLLVEFILPDSDDQIYFVRSEGMSDTKHAGSTLASEPEVIALLSFSLAITPHCWQFSSDEPPRVTGRGPAR